MTDLALFSGGMPGLPEILIILFVILLLFGAKRLPELARSLGKSLGEFKKGRREGERPIGEDVSADAARATSTEEDESPAQKED